MPRVLASQPTHSASEGSGEAEAVPTVGVPLDEVSGMRDRDNKSEAHWVGGSHCGCGTSLDICHCAEERLGDTQPKATVTITHSFSHFQLLGKIKTTVVAPT